MASKITSLLARWPYFFEVSRRILENNFAGEKAVIAKYWSREISGSILDIGCGTGEFSRLFPPEQYLGLDINPDYIAYAKRKQPYQFMVGDATQLTFSDQSFDKVLMIGVLHHLDDTLSRAILSEIKRVVKIGGRVILMEDLRVAKKYWLTTLMHNFDEGKYIRSAEEYQRLLPPDLKLVSSFSMWSGICPYQVFILDK
ncbi:MAG: class I SAM-dependent methyltransferase [Candidatus Komeilibacteria bacterium]